jgi:hypothetical protein
MLFACAGNQAELQALATNPATRFSMFFDEGELTTDGKCPEGYLPANPPSDYYEKEANGKKLFVQCLKFKVRTIRRQHLVWCAILSDGSTWLPSCSSTGGQLGRVCLKNCLQ